MEARHEKGERILGLGLLLFLGSGSSTPQKICDPDGPPHPLLESLANTLDDLGIDVILGSAHEFEAPGASNDCPRPRLARLAEFKNNKPDGKKRGEFDKYDWTRGFKEGYVGAVMAARKEENPPKLDAEMERCLSVLVARADITCNFIMSWLAAQPGKRIFVAFTRDDLQYANQVVAALLAEGYTAFVYIREGEQEVVCPKI